MIGLNLSRIEAGKHRPTLVISGDSMQQLTGNVGGAECAVMARIARLVVQESPYHVLQRGVPEMDVFFSASRGLLFGNEFIR